MKRNRLLLAASAFALISGAAFAAEANLAAVVADPNRPTPDIARDAERKPADVLAFAGIKSGMKVADFTPGQGYWTRLLSKTVGPKGKVYAVVPFLQPYPWTKPALDAAKAAGKSEPDDPVDPILPIARTRAYANVMALLEDVGNYGGEVSLPEQVDVVWSADTYHDLHNKNALAMPLNMPAIDKAIFRTLKPGGIFVVIDHAAEKGAGFSQTETLHRSDSEAVKAEIVAAGFTFDSESKVLAQGNDDHMKRVADDSVGGTTDRYILKFRKPLSAVGDKRHPDGALANYFENTFVLGPMLRIMYHADHTYQEFAATTSLLTSGEWYMSGDGHVCLTHQSEQPTRAFVSCHPFGEGAADKKIGDHWQEISSAGAAQDVSLAKGIVFP